jgi:hypothetical protein
MKQFVATIALTFLCFTGAAALACTANDTLAAGGLTTNLSAPNACQVAIGRFGFDSGGLTALGAQIADYYSDQGCRLDVSYFITHVSPSTPLCQLQDYVRFQ